LWFLDEEEEENASTLPKRAQYIEIAQIETFALILLVETLDMNIKVEWCHGVLKLY
jgi:hypothetical protein